MTTKMLTDNLPGTGDLLHALGLQYERNSASTFTFGIGVFALGALAGAVAALLFAPRSGADLRRDLKGRAQRVRDDVAERFETARHGVAAESRP